MLSEWDRRYSRENQQAILFELAMDELASRAWDELDAEGGRRVYHPSSTALAELLADSSSVWWDDRRTPARETRDSILGHSLRAAFSRATERYGEPESGGWRWDRVRTMRIHHLLRIPALSASGGPKRRRHGYREPDDCKRDARRQLAHGR